MATMTVADALRVAEIFEADDVISVPAMSCRILAKYAKELEEKAWPMPDVMFQCVAMTVSDGSVSGSALLDIAFEYGYLTEEQRDTGKKALEPINVDSALQK